MALYYGRRPFDAPFSVLCSELKTAFETLCGAIVDGCSAKDGTTSRACFLYFSSRDEMHESERAALQWGTRESVSFHRDNFRMFQFRLLLTTSEGHVHAFLLAGDALIHFNGVACLHLLDHIIRGDCSWPDKASEAQFNLLNFEQDQKRFDLRYVVIQTFFHALYLLQVVFSEIFFKPDQRGKQKLSPLMFHVITIPCVRPMAQYCRNSKIRLTSFLAATLSLSLQKAAKYRHTLIDSGAMLFSHRLPFYSTLDEDKVLKISRLSTLAADHAEVMHYILRFLYGSMMQISLSLGCSSTLRTILNGLSNILVNNHGIIQKDDSRFCTFRFGSLDHDLSDFIGVTYSGRQLNLVLMTRKSADIVDRMVQEFNLLLNLVCSESIFATLQHSLCV